MLSYAFEYRLFGLNPRVYHATNVIVHLLNALLVFWLIMLVSGRRIRMSLIATLLFSVHPLRVESVAWISERKDVLYSAFFLSALIAYVYYVIRRKKSSYYLSLLLFLLSLLSKSAALTFPLVLFLVDYLFRRKWDRACIVEKAPFFILGMTFGIMTIITQSIPTERLLAAPSRILIACYGLALYAHKILLPVDLSAIYPFPPSDNHFFVVALSSAMVLVMIVYAVYLSRRFTRKIIFGSLFICINILPVLQLVPFGIAIIADRYTYLPSIGVSYLAAEGIMHIYYRARSRFARAARQSIALLVFMLISWFIVLSSGRIAVWHDSFTLFNDVIDKYPMLGIAYEHRGLAHAANGNFGEAIADCTKAIALYADDVMAYNARGFALYHTGRFEDALADYNKALTIDPRSAETYASRGLLYATRGDFNKAIADYNTAIALNPHLLDAYINRGLIYQGQGDYDKAISDSTKAVELSPRDAEAYLNRGAAYDRKGDIRRAISDYDRAITLDPYYAEAYANRGSACIMLGEYDRTIADCTKAVRINPQSFAAYNNRGIAYYKKGDLNAAISDYTKALSIDPRSIDAYKNRALAYAKTGMHDKGRDDIRAIEGMGGVVHEDLLRSFDRTSGRTREGE